MRRLDYLGIAFILISVLFCAYGLMTMQTNTEDVIQWLPDHSTARKDYQYFESRFGSDDFVVVTWKGCTLEDPRLARLAEYLRAQDEHQLIQSVVTGIDITERLGGQLGMSEQAIAARLKGVFFGVENPKLTCAYVELSAAGTAQRTEFMQLFWAAVDHVPDLSRQQVIVGGYPFVATAIDGQLKNSFRFFLFPSILLSTAIALVCLRNFALTMIVFVTAVGAAAMSIALVPVCGYKFGGLMSIIPALVFVLTTSGCIHLVRYSLSVLGDTRKLLAIGWRPCAISTATTAVGMLSLTRSEFPAIRNFGFFCATGVGFSLMFQLVMVPWLLNRFGRKGIARLADRSAKSEFWLNWLTFVSQHRGSISLISGFIMVAGAIGLMSLRAEVEVEKLFRADSPILASIQDLERQLGPLDQTEVLLLFDDAKADSFPDRVNQVRAIQAAIGQLPQVSFTHSLINYLPSEPGKSNARSFVRRSAYRSVLRRERENLGNQQLLLIDKQLEIWRISLRFPFSRTHDFDKLAADVQATVKEFGNKTTSTDQLRMIYTGKTHLFQHAQLTLLSDLFQNFLLAFVIITPMLMIVLRSIRFGLIAMLPNLFPTLMVFGGLGWVGFPVDLAIAMTASVALGIAVDDTTHFMIRFRDFGGDFRDVASPMRSTILQCGPAMMHTTLIGCAGLMVYYFGEMQVVSRFSLAISSLLMIALLADLIMLPAILSLFEHDQDDGS